MNSSKAEADRLPAPGDIDRLVHEPSRLLILATLYVLESADFLFLMRQTGLTKGNLSSHLRKLEDGEYIEVEKVFMQKIPRTLLRLSEKGRTAFQNYRKSMTQWFDELP